MRDNKEKYNIFTRRALFLGCTKGVVLSCLLGRFYYLQILNSDKYKTLSNKNRLRVFLTPAKRGIIYDANGKILANNIKAYSLYFKLKFRRSLREVVDKINNILIDQKIDVSSYADKISKLPVSSNVKLLSNLSQKNVVLLSSHPDLQEIKVEDEYVRIYPFKESFFHTVGYLGISDKKQNSINSIPKNYDLMDGKDGVEKVFNDNLEGKSGVQRIEVDAKGNFVKNIDYVLPVDGENLQLSIDQNIQQKMINRMQDRNGSVIIMDLSKNKIVGMLSKPQIDPNIFINGVTYEKWDAIVGSKDNVLNNKCISTNYHPGSIFKVVMYLAILNANLDHKEKIFCPGHYTLGDRVYKCWKKTGHGYVDLNEAFAESCNVYFYEQSLKVGIKRIDDMATSLGLGRKTNIELPFEKSGLMPNPSWKKEKYGVSWFKGDTINTTIGQGYMEFTPIQMICMLAKIVNCKDIVPSIISKNHENEFADINIKKSHLNMLKKSMFSVFYNKRGTGYQYRILDEKYQIAGKSGTSQIIGLHHKSKNLSFKDHSLFIGYAPFHKPKYAIITIVEHGGWGSKAALPISRDLLLDIRDIDVAN
ncbi:MAG: penicillin-binding protein 2 [Candidatus Midichloriaceae bacterium]|jgi:penicillin-binding protein 2